MSTNERDRAAEARAGGALITGYLSRFWDGIEEGTLGRHLISFIWPQLGEVPGMAPADGVSQLWRTHLSPAGGTGTGSGRETTALVAQSIARGHHDNGRPIFLDDAEAMMSWPIYRAALSGLTRQDRDDLSEAIDVAHEDLDYRAHEREDYDEEDLPAIDEKLARWDDLRTRLA